MHAGNGAAMKRNRIGMPPPITHIAQTEGKCRISHLMQKKRVSPSVSWHVMTYNEEYPITEYAADLRSYV
jgi:hypothetical protein